MITPRIFKMKTSMILRISPVGRIVLSLMGLGLFLLLTGLWIGAVSLVLVIPFLIKLNKTIKNYDFVLTPEGFEYEESEVKWKEVKKVEFSNINKSSSSRFTKHFYDPVINVQTIEGKLAIITQNYKEGRALRDAFEEACKENSIKCKVEDKGS